VKEQKRKSNDWGRNKEQKRKSHNCRRVEDMGNSCVSKKEQKRKSYD